MGAVLIILAIAVVIAMASAVAGMKPGGGR
jgi:hypothetical protein